MSDREPDPTPEPLVLSEEDDLPREPALPADPYTRPGRGPSLRERKGWPVVIAVWIVVLGAIAFVLWAIFQ